jgi:hypothetical protein
MATTRKLEFPVPSELKTSAAHIRKIAIEGDSFIIKHKSQKVSQDDKGVDQIKFQITGYPDEDLKTLRKWAEANFFFVNDEEKREELTDQLVSCVHNIYTTDKEAERAVAEIKAEKDEQFEAVEEAEEVRLKKQYLHKYFDKSQNVLYEAVLLGNKPCFVNIDWDFRTHEPFVQLSEKLLLPDAQHPRMELLPPEREMYLSKPYEFSSENEIDKYLKLAVEEETLDTLYRKQKILASKYIDANNTHLTMLAADAIASYFQDKLGQTHYDMFVGDNDTGKTANLVYFQYEGYRAMLDVDITPANIYGFLGNFEEAQGCILEDEADDIDKQPEKMKIYKAGYNAGKKVTRTDISGFGGRKTIGWNTYCFKVFTAEEAPDRNKAKGFLDRTFVFHCTSGSPPYDIQEVTNPAGDNEFVELLKELDHNRKLLFSYRLLHYQDPLPNIELSVRNREKQLCKPGLRLFQDAECQEEIGIALADMIGQKRGIKRDTLEAKILGVISRIIANREKEEAQRSIDGSKEMEWVFARLEPHQIPTAELFDSVRLDLGGEYKREKDKSFDTEEHGFVSHDKIRRVCVDKFGAEPKRSNSVRYLEFNKEKLEKAKAAYIFPEKVTILQKNVRESGSDPSDRDDEVLGYTEGNKEVSEDETNQEVSNNSTKESESMKEIEQAGGNGHGKEDKESDVYPQTLSSASLLSRQNSEFTIQEPKEETLIEVINKCMLDGQGNNKDYFTKEDFIFICQMWPNLHWNENESEQTFYQLLEECRIEEFEPGRFKPTTT